MGIDFLNTKIDVDKNFQELKQHGSTEFPVAAYYIDMEKMYLGHVRWHWHEEIEFTLIKEGAVTFLIGEDTITLSSGQAIFINQNVLHSSRPVSNQKNIIHSLVIHPNYLFGHGQPSLRRTYLFPLLTATTFKYYIFDSKTLFGSESLSLIHRLFDINQTRHYGYELLTRGYLCELWFSLLTKLNPNVASAPAKIQELSQDEERVKRAILFIESHYAEALSLEDISASIHLSRSECCRCFKRSLKITPFEYLMNYRIYISVQKMMEDKKQYQSISQLASLVGFNNTSYYNKLFKKYLHCTPMQYRKQLMSGIVTDHSTLGLPIELFP